MRFLIFTVLVSLSLQLSSYAQVKYTYREKFVEGNYLILEDNYGLALKNFLDAYNLDSTNANINYLVGLCYLKSTSEKSKAIFYLKNASGSVSEKYSSFDVKERNAPISLYYYLGQAYHLSYEFDSSIVYYQRYKSYLKSPKQDDLIKDINHQIEMCTYAKEFMAMPTNISISNLGDSVNSAFADHSPVISADESMLIFTSRRPGDKVADPTYDEQYDEDIYICYKKPDGAWTSPVSIGENINTTGHEATIGLSADGSQLFIYKDDGGDGNIYLSTLDGDVWTTPMKMGSQINTSSWEPSACLAADGSTLYFVSDKKGGYGGRDIYKSVRLPNGEWSLSTNLGPSVNTEYDDDAPFIHPNRITLYFSSKGHKSMGGFDVFYTNKTDSGWTNPTNLLPPINTPDDDIYYVSSTDGKRAYYSSVKAGGIGEKDIYLIKLEEAPQVEPVALVIGRILPEKGMQIPKDMEIVVTNLETSETGYYKPNTKTGKYILPLVPGGSYEVQYKIGDKECFTETLNIPEGTDYQEIQKELLLDPVNVKCAFPLGSPVESEKAPPVKEKSGVIDTPSTPLTKNEPKPIEKNSTPQNISYEDIIYKVQISTTTRPALYDAFKGMKDVEYEKTEKGLYRYYVGTYKTKGEGKIRKEEVIKKGFDDAIVVPFKGTLLAFDDTPPASGKRKINTETLTSFTNTEFSMFFKYNITEINPEDSDYIKFINQLSVIIKEKGKVSISIAASSSQVPTRAFKTNKELALNRAENAKKTLLKTLKERGVDSSKINFVSIKGFVNGPKYNDDYLINKSTYEKFQHVKITIVE